LAGGAVSHQLSAIGRNRAFTLIADGWPLAAA